MVKTVIFNVKRKIEDDNNSQTIVKIVFIPKKGPAYSCISNMNDIDFKNNSKFYREFFSLQTNVNELYINFMEDRLKVGETSQVVQFINMMKCFNNLDIISLNIPHNSYALAIFKSFQTCFINVKTLILGFGSCSLDDNSLVSLNVISSLVDLETLCVDISHNKITDHCIATLNVFIKPPKLKNFYMKIYGNRISKSIIYEVESKLEVSKIKHYIQKEDLI